MRAAFWMTGMHWPGARQGWQSHAHEILGSSKSDEDHSFTSVRKVFDTTVQPSRNFNMVR